MALKRQPKQAARTHAVIYTRVSTDEQVENLSLPTQEERSRKFCAVNGWPVAKVFVDAGRSAKTTKREEFQEMLKFCKEPSNSIGYLIVHDFSRFARKIEDQIGIIAELKIAGVALCSVMQPTDETAGGHMQRNIIGVFNQYDNELKAEKTILGMQQAANLGRFPFKAPLGYINVSAHTGRNLIPDAKIAPLIKAAFELASTGIHSKAEILKKLTGLGLQTTKGIRVSAQTFHKILLNPIYAGWVVIPSWGLKVRGSFEPLISDELFQKVQDVLSGKRVVANAYQRNNPDFPLRVFVRCEQCNEPVTGSWSTGRNKQKHAYYHCRGKGCRGVHIKRAVLERKFVEYLEWLTPTPALFSAFREEVDAVWKRRQGDSKALFANAQRKLSIATAKKDKLVDLLIAGTLDETLFKQQVSRLDKEQEEILEELRTSENQYLDFEGLMDFADKIASRPARLWIESAIDQRQRLQKVFFPHGLSFDGEEFGTGVPSFFFNVLNGYGERNDDLASLTGFEPVSPP